MLLKKLINGLGAVLIAVIIGCFCVFQSISIGIPIADNYQLQHSVTVARPCYQIGKDYACEDDHVILLDGYIDNDTLADVTQLATQNPQIDMLCLNSIGGEVEAAMDIVQVMVDHNINRTCVAEFYETVESKDIIVQSQCSSACTSILMSGDERIKFGEARALIGVHGWTFTIKSLAFKGNWRPKISKYLAMKYAHPRVKKHEYFIEWSNEFPGHKMHYLTKSEMERFGVFTK